MSLSTTCVRIKVTLADVAPEVMRRLVVPLTFRLDRLHLTLQAAFGWTDSHLFAFQAGGMNWGIPDPDGDFGHPPIDARKSRLHDIIRETGAKTIHYLYDFGDGWDHVIKLEKWFENSPMDGLPFLLEANGRCPPEDVGGPPGYAGYLEPFAILPTRSMKACSAGDPTPSIRISSTKSCLRLPSRHWQKNGRHDGAGRDRKIVKPHSM